MNKNLYGGFGLGNKKSSLNKGDKNQGEETKKNGSLLQNPLNLFKNTESDDSEYRFSNFEKAIISQNEDKRDLTEDNPNENLE